jgi:hypothetical protein
MLDTYLLRLMEQISMEGIIRWKRGFTPIVKRPNPSRIETHYLNLEYLDS